MKFHLKKRALLIVALQAAIVTMIFEGAAQAGEDKHDVLAITDQGLVDPTNPNTNLDDSVRFFDAKTGKPLKRPVVPPGTGLAAPAGILFNGHDGKFIVVNQNVFQPFNGEVIRYDRDGRRLGFLVSRDDPRGPLAPRGAVLYGNDARRILFVADQGDFNFDTGQRTPGKLLAYRVEGAKATFLANLDPNLKKPGTTGPQFQPRAIVLGPDGYLYVSLRNLPEACGGSIVRFDPKKLAFKDILLSNPADCAQKGSNDLHRPEGLVFSPDGDLYITSFRRDPTDNDKILIIPKKDIHDRRITLPLDRIDLYSAAQGQPRAFAQALLFGPDGHLFVPISNTGEVRRYNVRTKGFWTFIAPGKGLIEPQYLSFGKTNPATLSYEGGEH